MFSSQHQLERQLKGDEGLVLKWYPDSRRIGTIGYGHRWLAGDPLVCTQEWAQDTLISDMDIAINAVYHNIPFATTLSDPRFGVLANMAFNMGIDGLLEFDTFLPLMKQQAWASAAKDLASTEWAGQVGMRSTRLRDQIVSDIWQYA